MSRRIKNITYGVIVRSKKRIFTKKEWDYAEKLVKKKLSVNLFNGE